MGSESRFGEPKYAAAESFQMIRTIPKAGRVSGVGRAVLHKHHEVFSGPSSEVLELNNRTLSFDQKFSRVVNRHLIKTGFRWIRDTGNKLTTQNPQFQYQTLADALANIPQSINLTFGTPRYQSHLTEFGLFFQDDWRLGANLVLNLGVRYDRYWPIQVRPTTAVPAEAVNLAPATDLRRMDFGRRSIPCGQRAFTRYRAARGICVDVERDEDRRARWSRLPV